MTNIMETTHHGAAFVPMHVFMFVQHEGFTIVALGSYVSQSCTTYVTYLSIQGLVEGARYGALFKKSPVAR